jgi:glutamyl-tRNA reductase
MLSGSNSAKTAKTKPLSSSSLSVRSVAVGLLALSLSGCLTTSKTVIVGDCAIFTAISYSASHDTVETVTQIRRHNARYLELCKHT